MRARSALRRSAVGFAFFLLVLPQSAWTTNSPIGASHEADAVLRARDSACGLEVAVAPGGTKVTGLAEDRHPWHLDLCFRGWGRGDRHAPVEPGAVTKTREGVDIDRGSITEWFRSGRHGIEHGFTIRERPRGDGLLHIDLAVAGGFEVEVLPGNRDVRFRRGADGLSVLYTGLCAWDDVSRELRARFTATDGGLSLTVQDLGAVYPITIDPWIWVEDAMVTAGVPNLYRFGGAMDLLGDTAVVSARGYNPDIWDNFPDRVMVFANTGSTWAWQAALKGADSSRGDVFGYAVSLSGDSLLSGAPYDHIGPVSDAGSAYVFRGAGPAWIQEAKLLASDGAANRIFGKAVAISGDTALVAANDDTLGSDSGSVYVFDRVGTTWSETTKLLASNGGPDHKFGSAVALQGDTALIGATGLSGGGGVYVFERSGTTWNEITQFAPGDPAPFKFFGEAISLSGDSALVGAVGDDAGGAASGAAYVFVRSGSIWSQQAKLKAPVIEPYSSFGQAVALAGDQALVGAYRSDDLGNDSGAAHVFVRSNTAWNVEAKLLAGNGAANDQYGLAVALNEGTALVGAPYGGPWGAAYFYSRFAQASATVRTAGSNPNSYFANTLPVLGGTYTATVDLAATTGHSHAWLIGFTSPVTFFFPGGQALLVDVFPPNVEMMGQPILPGPIVTYALSVPNDLILVGLRISSQAVHIGGGQPFALSNAQDLFAGY